MSSQEMDDANADTINKFRVEVKTLGENTWCTNGLRFENEDAALDYAHDLFRRWTMADKLRIVDSSVPLRQPYEPGSEHPDWKDT